MQIIRAFKVQADDGTIFAIVEYEASRSISEFRTTQGDPVEQVSEGMFEITSTGVTVREIS